MKKRLILFLILFSKTFLLIGQNTDCNIKVQYSTDNGNYNDVEAKCFSLSILKAKKQFTFIIFKREISNEYKAFKVFLNLKDQNNPTVINLQASDENIVKTQKLIGIPYFVIRTKLENNDNLISPSFVLEDFIPEIMKGVSEKDVEELKKEFEKLLKI